MAASPSSPLPALRPELDLMPSPSPEQPGLMIRDPFGFSDAVVIVPPVLARGLIFFDGEHSELDLRAYLTEATGEFQTSEIARHLVETLDQCGFVETPAFFEMRDAKVREFQEAPEKLPAHAGSGYPDEPDELRQTLDAYAAEAGVEKASADGDLIALAAPHVSPFGGYRSYAAAYRRLATEHAGKTFVILGTSHYGQPEKWGLTRKAYRTPFGPVETDRKIVEFLVERAGDAIEMEDYCHASEHSIEFQTVYLQHALLDALPEGERLRAVPILCGGLGESLITGKPAERNETVRRFFDALGELAEQRRDELVFVLGIDLAHIGRRYGDDFDARAEEDEMIEVRLRDHERLGRVLAGDADGFFDLVAPTQDDLRWCGYGPVYTFLKTVKGFRGETLSYEQWNIDEGSVVSFVGAEFREAGPSA